MKSLSLLLLASFAWFSSFSQIEAKQLFENHPELIIKFQIQDRSELESLTKIMSIDNVKGNEVIAYMVTEEFEHFLTLNIPYEIVEKPKLTPEELNMLDFEAIQKCRNDWNYYPSYDAYISMMQQFADDYPDICRLVEFGTTVQNRKLLACVLSKNAHTREAEPQAFLSSSMHGDELVGYVLLLRYIDYLLSNYGTDERITHLLDNMEIWVNPLANPDGTYITGNSSVSGAIRNNANNKDLNRNYPDDVNGGNPPPGYGPIQKETEAFIALQQGEKYTLAVNIHGGAEVCNYPWDNKTSLAADNDWWVLVCREYADTVHKYAPSNYMNSFNNGIVRGCVWYMISGGRQDYANYYDNTREFCLEISNNKTPGASNLPNYWNWNYRSFLNYTQQALYGIQGVVTDACSCEPLYATITLPTDIHNSFVTTDTRVGFYARPIKGGTYSVTYSAVGYAPQTVSITVSDKQKVTQNIELWPLGVTDFPNANFEADKTEIFQMETVQYTDLSENASSWEWFFDGGTPQTSTDQHPTVVYENHGIFDVKLRVSNAECTDEMLLENYITVNRLPNMPVANFEADKTEILENETVNFTNLSENATDWVWYFEGGFPETSIEQNPSITYFYYGNFDVKLTVYNTDGNDEILKENYIFVNQVNVCETEDIAIKIFPNPVLQEATLTIETDLPVSNIELVNVLGVIVKSEYLDTTPYSFSVSGVVKGLYVLKITTTKGVYYSKIQIQ